MIALVILLSAASFVALSLECEAFAASCLVGTVGLMFLM
jgi:hypothetical protein